MFRSSVSNEAIYLAQSIPGPFDGALPEAISDAASIRKAVPETIEALEVQTDTMVSAAQEVGMTISASRLPYAPYLRRPETSGRVVSILAAGSPGRPFDRQPVSAALHRPAGCVRRATGRRYHSLHRRQGRFRELSARIPDTLPLRAFW